MKLQTRTDSITVHLIFSFQPEQRHDSGLKWKSKTLNKQHRLYFNERKCTKFMNKITLEEIPCFLEFDDFSTVSWMN